MAAGLGLIPGTGVGTRPGKAEMLLTHTDIFVPVDLKRRVFAKAQTPDATRFAEQWKVTEEVTRSARELVKAAERILDAAHARGLPHPREGGIDDRNPRLP